MSFTRVISHDGCKNSLEENKVSLDECSIEFKKKINLSKYMKKTLNDGNKNVLSTNDLEWLDPFIILQPSFNVKLKNKKMKLKKLVIDVIEIPGNKASKMKDSNDDKEDKAILAKLAGFIMDETHSTSKLQNSSFQYLKLPFHHGYCKKDFESGYLIL